MSSDQELIIDESNFHEYFFDVRKHSPKKGQIMAKYSAVAELVDGRLKRDLVNLLMLDKASSAVKVLNKLGCAKPPDDIRICKEITQDLLNGLSVEEIIKKPYKYILEVFYYTQKEYVPRNDFHWETIEILLDRKQLDEQIKKVMSSDI